MTLTLQPEAPAAAPPLDTTRRYVRVRGERRGLVEFDFAIGEPELFVELMLAPDAFADFCHTQQAIVLDAADPVASDDADTPDWRLSDVGTARPA